MPLKVFNSLFVPVDNSLFVLIETLHLPLLLTLLYITYLTHNSPFIHPLFAHLFFKELIDNRFARLICSQLLRN